MLLGVHDRLDQLSESLRWRTLTRLTVGVGILGAGALCWGLLVSSPLLVLAGGASALPAWTRTVRRRLLGQEKRVIERLLKAL